VSTDPFAPLKIELRRASLVKTEPVFDLSYAAPISGVGFLRFGFIQS
jgi:hypothetical protein